jgi:hypothetical protein
MKTKISNEDLKNLQDSFGKFKQMFDDIVGKSPKKGDYTDIKTFEDACEDQGVTPEQVISANDTPDETAYKKLKVVSRAINGDWKPDWDNSNQKKWYPWFNLSSGLGFSDAVYDFDRTAASVGSRLCFESEGKAKYAGNQFLDLYKLFLK